MKAETRIPISVSGEDGVAMVTVALWLPLLVLFVSFVIDVGNWFLHDRHLQLQADAGALAAAGDFSFPCDNTEIEATARQYSGTAGEGSGYNHQVGGTPPDEVHIELNSPTYFDQPSPIDEAVAGPPCETGMVDVKLTETDLPLFFQVLEAFDAVPFINAHARVEIFEQGSIRGALPVAVPDPNPRSAEAIFIDEKTGNFLDSTPLARNGTTEGLAIWDNAAEPLLLEVDQERIGVRIALSGSESTECGEPLVTCYDAESTGGILFARGYSTAGSGAQPGPPLAHDAYLLSDGTCNRYFNSEVEGCSVGLHAEVDFGPCEEIGEVGPELTAVVGNDKYPMSVPEEGGCDPETDTTPWETVGAPIPVPANAGPVEIELEWEETKGKQGGNECKEGGGNKCKGSFGIVQQSFAGNEERSGPIRLAEIWDEAGAGANSFKVCSIEQEDCPAVVVKVGVDLNLLENAQSAEDPVVELRVTDANQNQSLDCDHLQPNPPNLRQELANGCEPSYTRNEGTPCPDPSELTPETEPWDCVAVQTGVAVGQIDPGMSERVHGDDNPDECVNPNDWASFPDLDPGDPRIIPVFVTAFGSFSGTGNETVPVTDFATFYVTGWSGQGAGSSSQSICPGDDPAEPRTIVGHFIQYVQAFNDGSASEETCNFESNTSITPCVAVLTQ